MVKVEAGRLTGRPYRWVRFYVCRSALVLGLARWWMIIRFRER